MRGHHVTNTAERCCGKRGQGYAERVSVTGAQPRLKSWGGQGLGPNTLRPSPGQIPGWVLGAGGGSPLPMWGSGGITSAKFLKTQMLNPLFWWLLAVKFLAFLKTTAKKLGGRTNTLLVPQPKSWGTRLRRSLRLLRLWWLESHHYHHRHRRRRRRRCCCRRHRSNNFVKFNFDISINSTVKTVYFLNLLLL